MRFQRKGCCFIENRDIKILQKIIQYCDRAADNIKRFNADYSVFEQDVVLQDACCMCVIQIGELAGELSDEAKALAKDVPWRLIKDTRNFYVHAYGAIDLNSVWATLNDNLPQLKESCITMLKQ